MADPALRLPANAAGPLYVDRTCIDCDACRQLAPAIFADAGGRSSVRVQPSAPAAVAAALQALVACPVGAIGDAARRPVRAAIASFPLPIDGPVAYLGFNARSSYGASSYLVEDAAGNWMIDAPRWNLALVRELEARGGVRTIFLTHRDDVADADLYAERFGAQRIIHEADLDAEPSAEVVLRGTDMSTPVPGFTIIPVPGHTRGHSVLLYQDKYLFSGDHLEGDEKTGRLDAWRDYCWYDWDEQARSMDRLRDFRFEWVLPGHGGRLHLPPGRMREELAALADRMKGRERHSVTSRQDSASG
jgi:glyoxylase-like metal-dependent hydrolase (beta-lactamase superfamily II)/ferredoxin